MATFQNTSGTSDFTEIRDNIINRALRICSVIADEELPTDSMTANCTQALNDLIKQWDALGIHVWTESEAVLFPQPLQYKYELNWRKSNDHASATFRLSSLVGAIGPGGTQAQLGDITNYDKTDTLIGDHIGIVLDTGTVFWSLVSDPTGVTFADPLTSSASAGNTVFIYTDKLPQPLRVPSARRFLLSGRIDMPLFQFARIDYREQPNKETPGTITQYFYDPQVISGYFYLWPNPQDLTAIVRFTWYRRLQDFTNSNDVPDLPQEWANAIIWNLAKEIAPEYDVPIQKYSGIIVPNAAQALDTVQGWDREDEPTYFGCDNRWAT